MLAELALKLVAIFEAYSDDDELRELTALFDVSLESLEPYDIQWLSVARELVSGLDAGNNRRLLDSVLDLASARNSDGVAHTSFERQAFHRELGSMIDEAQCMLQASAAPSEITVSGGSVFSAKSRVRELLDTAQDEVFIVDPYVGVGTLDCLRDLEVPVRILTGEHASAVEDGLDRAVVDFIAEGHELEVRRCSGLHDRHLIFNDRCWLVGGSLKDAGKKQFNCIEVVDKARLLEELAAKWTGAAKFP